MKKAIILLTFLGLTGCVATVTPEQMATADYGPAPKNPQQLAEAWVKPKLLDPFSAVFDHTTLAQGYSNLLGEERQFGWIQCGGVNAKNLMGGFVGRQDYFVVIRYDKVVTGYVDNPTLQLIRPAQFMCHK